MRRSPRSVMLILFSGRGGWGWWGGPAVLQRRGRCDDGVDGRDGGVWARGRRSAPGVRGVHTGAWTECIRMGWWGGVGWAGVGLVSGGHGCGGRACFGALAGGKGGTVQPFPCLPLSSLDFHMFPCSRSLLSIGVFPCLRIAWMVREGDSQMKLTKDYTRAFTSDIYRLVRIHIGIPVLQHRRLIEVPCMQMLAISLEVVMYTFELPHKESTFRSKI